MNSRSFRERDGCRSFLSALASIWRMRSRVTANDWPTSSGSDRPWLREKVRGYDADEFAGCDYLGLLPELWKMALVAGDQIVGASGVGTFQELVVVGIARYLERTRRDN